MGSPHGVPGNIDDFKKDMTAGFWKPAGTPQGDLGGVTSEASLAGPPRGCAN
jgi:hypothetical protein